MIGGYQLTVEALGVNTQKILLQMWTAVLEGRLARADFPDVAAQVVAVSNERGRAAAEVALNGYMTAATGEVTLPAGYPPRDDRERLVKAFNTILASDDDRILMQLERLANAEPLESASIRFSEGIRDHPHVEGWIRSLEPNACELCVWWWREGRIWPKDHPMPTHKGCTCHPLPTLTTSIHSTEYTRRLERARLYERQTA